MSGNNAVEIHTTDESTVERISHHPEGDSSDRATEDQRVHRIIAEALRSIRYGTIVLTIHEGRLVELTKTVRSRFNLNK